MATERVGDMTMDELNSFVEEKIDKRIQIVYWKRTDTRTMDEVNESIRRNRWTPPPGAKSSLELLREDRDR
ncbi:MAG: hypothetical protein RLP44_11385 [Aggregatilineales bacterium]